MSGNKRVIITILVYFVQALVVGKVISFKNILCRLGNGFIQNIACELQSVVMKHPDK